MAVPSFTHLHGSLGLGLGLGYSPSWLLRVSLRRARGILPRQAQSTCEAESQRTHMGGVHMGGVHIGMKCLKHISDFRLERFARPLRF